MSARALVMLAAACALTAFLSIFAFDRAIALTVHESGIENAWFVVQGREFLDTFTGRGLLGKHVGIGQLTLGLLVIAIGAIWVLLHRTSAVARALIFAGAVQLATIETVWLIKDYFGRMRPYQLIAQGNWDHVWFAGGNSFPSGHNAFFWGLFLPLAYALPKYRIAFLIIPVFIAFARIDENYHFLSDVLAAIALAAAITAIAGRLLRRWIKPTVHLHQPHAESVATNNSELQRTA